GLLSSSNQNTQFTLHPHLFFLVLTLTGGSGACHGRHCSFLSLGLFFAGVIPAVVVSVCDDG
ncbi:hypothetical protein A2U01_0053665, partial [Trifolium medium]|nr:hypothetical protein [Trifolium medium]